MKNEDFKVKTRSGIGLWFAKRREKKHVEKVSRPVTVLGTMCPEPDTQQLARAQAVIKAEFISGAVLTTSTGNKLGKTVDFRKIVSRLRADGLPIVDEWRQNGKFRFKVYFIKKQQS
jgi:transcriptional regulator of met regulon